jgi:hypothetical protein
MAKFSDRHLNGLAVEPGQKDRLVFDDCPGLGAGLVPSWRNGPARRRVGRSGSRLASGAPITVEQARTAARARLGEVQTSKGWSVLL